MTGTELLFEISWEVCNMVGGIHTVLATKMPHMLARYGQDYVAVGPDLAVMGQPPASFREEAWDPELLEAMRGHAVQVRMGRWLVDGEPRCLLVNYSAMYARKDEILARYWEQYGLDSLFGGWDYYDPLLFGHAAALVVAQLYKQVLFPRRVETVVHCHEWMAAGAILHLRSELPEVGTVFTTHATTLGRALGNVYPGKNIASLLEKESPEQAARELNVVAKHSIESVAAQECDVFTTVSDVTAEECEVVLGRRPSPILPNGLGRLPSSAETRERARERLFAVAEMATGDTYDRENTLLVVSSGRYEFSNKGIDLLVDALDALRSAVGDGEPRGRGKRVLAYLTFPSGHTGPVRALADAAHGAHREHAPLTCTHYLRDEANDPIARYLDKRGFQNAPGDPVHVLHVPIYLDGKDDIFGMTYYELLSGATVGAFPSWYEPWGYTPMEAVALEVPTVTTDLAGFGRWVQARGDLRSTGVEVLAREEASAEIAARRLCDFFLDLMTFAPDELEALRAACLATATATDWSQLIGPYLEAQETARELARGRRRALPRDRFASEAEQAVVAESAAGEVTALVRHFTVRIKLPEALVPLRELAGNVWWRWHPRAAELFERIDPALWAELRENPSQLLEQASPARLGALAADPEYLATLEEQVRLFREASRAPTPEIAYFCMEYGLAGFLSLYSGGLGILAGDHLKGSSDMRLPLLAIGLAYEEGYFRQVIDAEGQQHAIPDHMDFRQPPFHLVTNGQGEPVEVTVPFPTGPVRLRAYRLRVGSVDLYLLNTDHEGNRPADRSITHQLYGGGSEGRLKQELVLGVGGVMLLEALGIEPKVFHMNEGHSAFLIFARLASMIMSRKLNRREALEYIRHTTVFTTHTPVPAGHDHFPATMIRPYLLPFESILQQDVDGMLAVGARPGDPSHEFITTYLALRGASRVNGVAAKHGEVSRKMFKDLFPGHHETEVPVTSITNGVHVPSWLAPEWQAVVEQEMGPGWREHLAEPERWTWIRGLPNERVWTIRLQLRRRLLEWLQHHLTHTAARRHQDPAFVHHSVAALEDPGLIIGFARRFAPYKRADLLYDELGRLSRVLTSDPKAMLLYAGKAHPADGLGQEILKRVYQLAHEPELQGRVIVIEGYDIDVARKLVAGCDVWLNTPMRPLEASGTSGMKAGINGCLNLSVGDGWWLEGYRPELGWMIDEPPAARDIPIGYDQSAYDRAAIFATLEGKVLPTYGRRGADGLPSQWIEMVKASIAHTIPHFSARRMLRDYQTRFYTPALEAARSLEAQRFELLRELTEHRQRVRRHWGGITFEDARIDGVHEDQIFLGTAIEVRLALRHPGLSPGDLEVQAVLARGRDPKAFESRDVIPLDATGTLGKSLWTGTVVPGSSGHYRLGFRVIPRPEPEELGIPVNLSLQKWL